MVQLSSATNSASETLAATSKAVKAANDNANGRVLHHQIFRQASWLFSTVMRHRGISLKTIGVKRFMTWLPATRYLFLNSVRYRKMLPGCRREGNIRSGTAQPG
ncbi:phage tail protein [Escherichia coli]|uniref:phage tail protein n=1 Tax=Escherichia coli TaxID=562 RepID=UPI00286DDC60|nr:phage tail protein [Escherichia coli]